MWYDKKGGIFDKVIGLILENEHIIYNSNLNM
jgi:hypothetical protein